MYKFYSLTEQDFKSILASEKLLPQQKQIYAALVRLGKPVRGQDAVAEAVAAGMHTNQPYDRLAAWYFSPKRRPSLVRMSGDATPFEPAGPATGIEALAMLVS